jgi:hypothetical protein
MYSDDDITKAQAAITAAVDAVRIESNLPHFEFARLLLNEVEDIARAEASLSLMTDRRLHEPDFVNLADTIAGVIANTDPLRQCR